MRLKEFEKLCSGKQITAAVQSSISGIYGIPAGQTGQYDTVKISLAPNIILLKDSAGRLPPMTIYGATNVEEHLGYLIIKRQEGYSDIIVELNPAPAEERK